MTLPELHDVAIAAVPHVLRACRPMLLDAITKTAPARFLAQDFETGAISRPMQDAELAAIARNYDVLWSVLATMGIERRGAC